MTKLTASQFAILALACSRDDGIAIRPDDLKPAAAAKVGAKLVELALVREVRAKGDMPVWREDEQGHSCSLKILKAGRLAVETMAPPQAASFETSDAPLALPSLAKTQVAAAKAGSKRASVLALLTRKEGVTIDDLMAATGWLPHTTRAALSGLRKSGLSIVRSRDAGADASVYRIEPGTVAG